jgi:deoxyhypusine synthase
MLEGSKLRIDPLRDVNQSAAVVWDAKASGGTSSVLILGGGSPKNFMLQTEPQIQRCSGCSKPGTTTSAVHRRPPGHGGLSGATPSEAMTWGKVDPDKLPGTVTCYVDSTVALPMLTAYALTRREPRPPKRLDGQAAGADARLEGRYAEVVKERGDTRG